MTARAILGALLALVISGPATVRAQANQDATPPKGLQLSVTADKEAYLPGELVILTLKLTNTSSTRVLAPPYLSAYLGDLRIYVDRGDDPGRQCRGPAWWQGHSAVPAWLAPGESVENRAGLLWNEVGSIPRRAPITDDQVYRNWPRSKLRTRYAFESPGTYTVTAALYQRPNWQEPVAAGSVTVRIEEPRGGDAKVWEVLYADADLGWFLQEGCAIPLYERPKAPALIETLEGLLKRYPSSGYAPMIRRSVEEYRQQGELVLGERELLLEGSPTGKRMTEIRMEKRAKEAAEKPTVPRR